VRYRLLGPFALLNGGATVPVQGAKVRALLVLLLLRPNQVVPTDVLAEDLWLGAPPTSARGTLQAYVSRARQALRRAAVPSAELVGRRSGYELAVEPGDIDAVRFERIASSARAVAAHEPATALASFSEALGMWRGPALVETLDLEYPAREAARLEGLRLAAIEDEVECRLALGEHATLVPRLQSLIGENPYRERMHGQLMLALYRSGRQADALQAYRNVHRVLRDELGVLPGPMLRGLSAGISAHEPALNPSAGPAGPAPVERYGEMAVTAAEQAAAWATRAGDEAVRVLGFQEAAGHYGRSLGALSLFGRDRPDQRGRLLVSLGRVQQAAYDLRAALDSYREAASLAAAIGDPPLLADAAWGLASATEYGMGQPATVDVLERALAVTDSAGAHLGARIRVLAALARSLEPGDPRALQVAAEAVALARRCVEPAALAEIPSGFTASPNFTAGFLAQTFLLRREQGRLAEALPSVEQVASGPAAALPWRSALALGLAETGAADRGRLEVDRLVHALRPALRDWLWLAAVAQTADAAIILGHRPAAGPLHDLLVAYAGRWVVVAHGVGHLGAVDSYLGGLAALLGQAAVAERRFAAAAALEGDARAIPALARTHLRHAQALAAAPRSAAINAAGLLLAAADDLAACRDLGGIRAAASRLRSSLPALPGAS
jgi:DNA-binding SARP family transcriptional activator